MHILNKRARHIAHNYEGFDSHNSLATVYNTCYIYGWCTVADEFSTSVSISVPMRPFSNTMYICLDLKHCMHSFHTFHLFQNPHNCILCVLLFCSVYALAIIIANYLAITGLEVFTLHLHLKYNKLFIVLNLQELRIQP